MGIKTLNCYKEISILISLVGLQLSETIIAFSYSVPLHFFHIFLKYTQQEKTVFCPAFLSFGEEGDQVLKKNKFLQSEIKLNRCTEPWLQEKIVL